MLLRLFFSPSAGVIVLLIFPMQILSSLDIKNQLLIGQIKEDGLSHRTCVAEVTLVQIVI